MFAPLHKEGGLFHARALAHTKKNWEKKIRKFLKKEKTPKEENILRKTSRIKNINPERAAQLPEWFRQD